MDLPKKEKQGYTNAPNLIQTILRKHPASSNNVMILKTICCHLKTPRSIRTGYAIPPLSSFPYYSSLCFLHEYFALNFESLRVLYVSKQYYWTITTLLIKSFLQQVPFLLVISKKSLSYPLLIKNQSKLISFFFLFFQKRWISFNRINLHL